MTQHDPINARDLAHASEIARLIYESVARILSTKEAKDLRWFMGASLNDLAYIVRTLDRLSQKTVLTVDKQGQQFVVDDKAMLGAPPVGRGRTLGMAIGDWLIQNQSRLGISFELTAAAQPSEATRSRQDRAGLIEETLKAIGVDVDFEDPEEMAAERNSTMGWLDPLEAYKPKVTLIERQARS